MSSIGMKMMTRLMSSRLWHELRGIRPLRTLKGSVNTLENGAPCSCNSVPADGHRRHKEPSYSCHHVITEAMDHMARREAQECFK